MSGQKCRVSLVIGGVLLLAGCAKQAAAPQGAAYGADYAEVVFELGLTDTIGMGNATNQEYRVSDTASFDDGAVVKIFTWAAKKPKPFLVRSGRKVFVFAKIDRGYGVPGLSNSGSNQCTNGSSFTPTSNGRYRVVQTGSTFGACELRVIEVATGAQPVDVARVKFAQTVAPQ